MNKNKIVFKHTEESLSKARIAQRQKQESIQKAEKSKPDANISKIKKTLEEINEKLQSNQVSDYASDRIKQLKAQRQKRFLGVTTIDWKTTDTYLKVVFESVGDVPAVGDIATIDGKPAAPGTYIFSKGYIVVIKDGKVASISTEPANNQAKGYYANRLIQVKAKIKARK